MINSSKYNDFTKKALILEMASRDIDIIDFVDFHQSSPISSIYIFKAKLDDNCSFYFKSIINLDTPCSYDKFVNDYNYIKENIYNPQNKNLFYVIFIKEQILWRCSLLQKERTNKYTESITSLIKKLSNKYDGPLDFLMNFENENLDRIIEDIYS